MSNSQNSWKSFTTVIGDKHNIQGSCFTSEGWMGYSKCKQSCSKIFFWPLFQVFPPSRLPPGSFQLPGWQWPGLAVEPRGVCPGGCFPLRLRSQQCRIPKCFSGIIYVQGLYRPCGSSCPWGGSRPVSSSAQRLSTANWNSALASL